MRGNLKWYVARLAAMSPREILHRIVELSRKKRLSGLENGWRTFEKGGGEALAPLPKLRERLAATSTFMLDEVLTKSRFLGLERPELFSGGVAPRASDWFADPVSGRFWPGEDVSAFSVDVRSTSAHPSAARLYGDVKFVWEPNRLQILHPLAAIIAGNTADAAAARELGLAIIRSWMQSNPPYRGVNWTSGIELALRLASLTLFCAALDGDAGTQDDRSALAGFVRAHAHMLEMMPSLHSSANNHRVAEGLGLYLAGHLCRDLGPQKRHGREILESETLLQILSRWCRRGAIAELSGVHDGAGGVRCFACPR